MNTHSQELKVQTACLLILSAIGVAVALYLLRPVMIPFIIATFFAFAITPFINFIVLKAKVPRAISVMIVLLVSFGILFIFSSLIVRSAGQFAENADTYQQVIKSNFIKAIDGIEELLDFQNNSDPHAKTEVKPPEDTMPGEHPIIIQKESSLTETIKEEFNLLVQQGIIQKSMIRISKVLADLLKQGLLIFIFVLFLLIGSKQKTAAAGGVWKEMETKIRSFLIKKVILSGATGILVGITLSFLGIEFALFFGFLTFSLNFIPSIGSLIATVLPLPMVFLHSNFSVGTAALVLLIPGSIQFLIGNILEPKIMGDVLDLHPVVILMALIFWGMIWGIVGMLLAAPITAILKILLEQNEMTKIVADLMAGRIDQLKTDG